MRKSMVFVQLSFVFIFSAMALASVPGYASYKTLKEEAGTSGETRWSAVDMPIKYRINEIGTSDVSDDKEFTAITNAFNTWAKPACTFLQTRYDGKTPKMVDFGDGQNTIDWVENEAEWPAEAGRAIAFTVPIFDSTGRFYEADVRFNGWKYSWSTSGYYGKMDVETIAVHELGHFFGLADLYDLTNCDYLQIVMCGTSNGTVKRALKQDDINGICYLYPEGEGGLCSYDTDCDKGMYCGIAINLEGTPMFFCKPPAGTGKPGQRCGDISNTPYNLLDDAGCLNGFCLDSQVCTNRCKSSSDCAYNMECGDVTVVLNEEGKTETFTGCATPPGCVRTYQCEAGKVCGLYRVGESFAQACIDTQGKGLTGDPCNVWNDCRSGICFKGSCSEICDDVFSCPSAIQYACKKQKVSGQDGKSDSFFICVDSGVPHSQDAGVDASFDGGSVNVDSGIGPGPDGSASDDVSGEIIGDDSGVPVECSCDSTYDCDENCQCDPECVDKGCECDKTFACENICECDPDCTRTVDTVVKNGCSCSSLGL